MSHAEPGFTIHWDLVVPCCHREPESSGYCFCIQRSFSYTSTHHACSLCKSDRKICVIVPEKSTEVPEQGKSHFVYFPSLSKVYCVCLSVGCVCKSNVLQNLKNTNICLTPTKKESSLKKHRFPKWIHQHMSILKWLSLNKPPVTTVSSLQPPVPPFHTMQHRVAKALLWAEALTWYQWPQEDGNCLPGKDI